MFSYFRFTRTTTYGFLAALPLLVGYEALILATNKTSLDPLRVSADVWTKAALGPFMRIVGTNGNLWLGAIAVCFGIFIFVRDGSYFRQRSVHRQAADLELDDPDEAAELAPDPDDDLELRPGYFLFMIAECVVMALVLATLVSFTVQYFIAHVEVLRPGMMRFPFGKPQFWQEVALSLGAGLYEELVFRVGLVALLAWPLSHLLDSKTFGYVIAAVASALVFSGIHYIGSHGDIFRLDTFMFRFVFGLALQVVLVTRGFAVAAWTHALYDVLVVMGTWDH